MPVAYLPLKAWNKKWGIEGPRLHCKRCGASQDLTDGSAFKHNLGCPFWGIQAQYPCAELHEILKQKIEAGFF